MLESSFALLFALCILLERLLTRIPSVPKPFYIYFRITDQESGARGAGQIQDSTFATEKRAILHKT